MICVMLRADLDRFRSVLLGLYLMAVSLEIVQRWLPSSEQGVELISSKWTDMFWLVILVWSDDFDWIWSSDVKDYLRCKGMDWLWWWIWLVVVFDFSWKRMNVSSVGMLAGGPWFAGLFSWSCWRWNQLIGGAGGAVTTGCGSKASAS